MIADALTDLERAQVRLTHARHTAAGGDYLAALRSLGELPDLVAESASVLAQAAYDAGATKKALGEALGVPPSTFRGMERGA